MPGMTTLQELLIDELKDLYSAEKQLTKALPKMQKGASDAELAKAFESHLRETEEQVSRLEEIGKSLEVRLTGKKCKGMEGVVEEGAEVLKEEGDEKVIDVAITGAARRVEHYEMAGYQAAIELAGQLGHSEVASLLKQSLDEEVACEEKLRELAERLSEDSLEGREEEFSSTVKSRP